MSTYHASPRGRTRDCRGPERQIIVRPQGQQLLKVAGCPHLIHAARVPWFHIPSVETRLRDVREISTGETNWKPERRKRVQALPAPQIEPETPEPEEDEMLAFAKLGDPLFRTMCHTEHGYPNRTQLAYLHKGPRRLNGRNVEAGHTTAPDHMPYRAKKCLHSWRRPHTSGAGAVQDGDRVP